VLDRELDSALTAIEDCYNPEIYHYQHGKHPGLKWYIKTILPSPRMLNDDTCVLFNFWKSVEARHMKHVCLTNVAYGWSGQPIPNWWTIWLDSKIDIVWSWSREHGFDYELVDYNIGLNLSGNSLESAIEINDTRHTGSSAVSYEKCTNIANFLKTYTSDQRSRQKRSLMKVIENDEVFPKAADGN